MIACLSVSRSVLLHRNWPVETTSECTLFLLKFHQNSWRSFFLFFFFWSSCELLLGTTTSLLISILYFTYTHLIKVKSDIWIDKRRGIQLLSVTWHKVLIQWRVGHKVNSNRISLNRDLRSRGSEIAEMLIQTNYKDSAGFTYLTWTFLFCSCIPALHDCSGCGQRDFGCWQPRKYIKFIVVDYSRGVRMI